VVLVKATITSYRYYPSGEARISTGHKGHSRPQNAFKGGNGTFLVADPPKVMVYFETETGVRDSVDMYGTIKYNSSRRITAKYVDTLMTGVIGQTVDTDHIYDDILQLMAHHIE
jgi:hypothetical protein